MSYKLQCDYLFIFGIWILILGEKCLTMNKEDQGIGDVRVEALQFAKPVCGLFLFYLQINK